MSTELVDLEMCDGEGCTRIATRFDHYPIRGQYCETHFDRLCKVMSSEHGALDLIESQADELRALRAEVGRLRQEYDAANTVIVRWAKGVDIEAATAAVVGMGATVRHRLDAIRAAGLELPPARRYEVVEALVRSPYVAGLETNNLMQLCESPEQPGEAKP